MARYQNEAVASGHDVNDSTDVGDALAFAAERFRPVATEDEQSRRTRMLRSERRARTQIRALLYAGRSFQTTTICDLSRTGAGVNGASGILPGDLVALQLLNGRAISGQVRWLLGGRCGIAFLEPLADFEAIVSGPHNRLRATPAEVPHAQVRAGADIVGIATQQDPYITASTSMTERLRERYLRKFAGS